jgi:hypothetical protein
VLLRWFPLARGPPGGAGDGSHYQEPGFPFLALDLFGCSSRLLPPSPSPKRKTGSTPPPGFGGWVSRLRYWLCLSLTSAHHWGAGFLASNPWLSRCPFLRTTILRRAGGPYIYNFAHISLGRAPLTAERDAPFRPSLRLACATRVDLMTMLLGLTSFPDEKNRLASLRKR